MLESVDLPGVQPVATMNPVQQCKGCRFAAKEDTDLVCRFDPPKVFMFPMPTKTQLTGGNGVALQSFSQFPMVRGDSWCGKWEKK